MGATASFILTTISGVINAFMIENEKGESLTLNASSPEEKRFLINLLNECKTQIKIRQRMKQDEVD